MIESRPGSGCLWSARIGRPAYCAALMVLTVLVPTMSEAQNGSSAELEKTIQEGDLAFTRGWLDQAIFYWTGALNAGEKIGQPIQRIDLLSRRAEAYQALGYVDKSITDLKDALRLAEAEGATERLMPLRGSLGNVYTLAGRTKAARAELETVLEHAGTVGDKLLEARTLNNLGNLMFKRGLYDEAADVYGRSASAATEAGQNDLLWTATINTAYAMSAEGKYGAAEQLLEDALDRADSLPENSVSAYGLVSVGRLSLKLEDETRQSRPNLRRLAYRSLTLGMRMAARVGDERAESYALGYMGQLYEREGRLEEAQHLTRQALFAAQRLNSPEALYLWQWQIGRIKRLQGNLSEATAAYRAAVATLSDIRADMITGLGGGRSSFQNSVRPVILGLADLLLQLSRDVSDESRQQGLLVEARSTVELMKAAELEDYFQDNCVAALRTKERAIDQIEARTAAVYPILLPDRVELLISLPTGLSRVSVPVGEDEIMPVANEFRRQLEKRTTRQYLAPARKLHRWLIEPMDAQLKESGVTTLVVIPSGALSTISFAALHDGTQHLIERMAIAVAPGLTLIEPRPIERETATALAGGLTGSVQGFPPLPHVEAELRNLNATFSGTILEDEEFLIDNVRQQLEVTPYNVVHVASHAQIGAEAKDSFLLTFDGRLTMDGLEQFVKLSRFRDEPVELLTLSACSTAAGDERAALGLAGIGIKAGARSALASLWFVNDQSTSLLISQFYAGLKMPGTSKAEALRQAQLSVMKDYRFRHPGFWAPFLLIGSWL